ncbi:MULTISPECIES: ead/Ea22-like family protein [Citrobacter]|uniref:ead/Ea22-like family protein n=1 Tax=Citrobacter werkmanii TaxID=67827 RepID=UPI003464DC50
MKIDYQAIRERYSPKPAPKCHICGAEMTVQRMSASRITYGCTGAIYDDKGCHYAEGRSFVDDHYEQSCVTVVDVSDPDVLAMLDELEAAKQDSARWFKAFEKAVSIGARYEERIAELESRTATLPEVEKWRSVDAVRAQNAYKVLVNKVLADIGIAIKEA